MVDESSSSGTRSEAREAPDALCMQRGSGTPDRMLATLQHLLEIDATDLHSALDQATQLVAEAMDADKVDAFLLDPAVQTLVATGTSDTPMGHRQHALGLDRLPLANGGRTVEIFETGQTYLHGHVDQDAGELRGVREGLGIRSEVGVPLEIPGRGRGVLIASSATTEFFTLSDKRFLQAVARWVGLVAHRAALIERVAADAEAHGRRRAAEELITVLAHDIGNLLAPLKSRIDLIARRLGRDDLERTRTHAIEAGIAL
ncbi:MAG TPA: GAF domain-containing protein, partial [Chloroflexota bacterium]|nr:GAF domain-containing protein [Chloroflexota bacterium]